MKKIALACVLAGLCLYAAAQENTRALTIGDTVPNILFSHILNGNQRKIDLYHFKNKNVIIDLWSRHCTSCIGAFPKIEQYQKKHSDLLQFILANPHDIGFERDVIALLKSIKTRTGFYPSLPVALNDTLLNLYFPHTGVPHYIWINNRQQIVAITGLEEITEQNIDHFVRGDRLHLAVKDAPQFSKDLLSLVRDGVVKDADLLGFSMFTGYQPYTNLKTGFRKNDSTGSSSYCIINQPLRAILYRAYGNEINGMPLNRLINFPNQSQKYCYQVILPNTAKNSSVIVPYLKEDLWRTFHLKGVGKKETRECFIIKGIQNIISLSSSAHRALDLNKNSRKKYIKGYSLKEAVLFLDQLTIPLLDESGQGETLIDLNFPESLNPKDERQLIAWLISKGFVIEKEPRLLDVFEFSTIN
ncbi:TlpA family protein disulfide reductase [Niabella drilacis]|uniref:Thiol-disulfide isomerase or thioredoxin n=1 Tax=Niabella drilacis (strain DSM 25811 / CCM 8410 / CCUG 62505 / LMG 26954 / E90) TaxID=1285928 RepID=A0A1G6XP10_NIADE|nr:thioredoxin family protein [Niabella drilacis]SDD79107.1 Thiol-disulfide isomerase or thioredoxin [Niabella drilacis]